MCILKIPLRKLTYEMNNSATLLFYHVLKLYDWILAEIETNTAEQAVKRYKK